MDTGTGGMVKTVSGAGYVPDSSEKEERASEAKELRDLVSRVTELAFNVKDLARLVREATFGPWPETDVLGVEPKEKPLGLVHETRHDLSGIHAALVSAAESLNSLQEGLR